MREVQRNDSGTMGGGRSAPLMLPGVSAGHRVIRFCLDVQGASFISWPVYAKRLGFNPHPTGSRGEFLLKKCLLTLLPANHSLDSHIHRNSQQTFKGSS